MWSSTDGALEHSPTLALKLKTCPIFKLHHVTPSLGARRYAAVLIRSSGKHIKRKPGSAPKNERSLPLVWLWEQTRRHFVIGWLLPVGV